MMDYIKKPKQIESGSLDIIEKEMQHPEQLTPVQRDVVKRIIHTTADFEYEQLVHFVGDVKEAIVKAMECRPIVYCDTRMIEVGLNKGLMETLGFQTRNYVHTKEAYQMAEERGITRSMAALEMAYKDEQIGIYLIGNAPTALMRLLELIEETGQVPELIVGVPVGFVGAKESKEYLSKTTFTHIRVDGRKGGSPVAVATMNALMKVVMNESKMH